MAISAQNTYTNNGLVPAYPNIPSPLLPIKLLPSLTLAKGTVLGEVAGAAAIAQGTITLAAAWTSAGAGLVTVTMSATNTSLIPGIVLTIDTGANAEQVTVLTKPTGTTFTAVVAKAHAASGVAVSSVASTGTGVYGAYVDANTDGTGVAKCILKYAVATDTSGMITLGTASTGGPFGEKMLDTPAYFGGAFRTEELTGLDAAALADLNAHYTHGNATAGVVVF